MMLKVQSSSADAHCSTMGNKLPDESRSEHLDSVSSNLSHASLENTGGDASAFPSLDVSQVYPPSSSIKITINRDVFEASAPALMLASPVWTMVLRDSFFPGSQSTGPVILPLEGDAKSASILLDIVHYRFGGIPEKLTIVELYQLCLMIAQYKCTHLVTPWARSWISQFNLEAPQHENCHEALWIAYTLGDKAWYKRLLKTIILTIKLDDKGDLVNAAGTKLLDMVLPTRLFDIISETRVVLLDTILVGVADSIKNESAAKVCRVGKDQEHCKAMMLGSAMPQLTRNNLFFPSPKPEEYQKSVMDLVNTVKGVKSLTFVGPNFAPHHSHEGCSLGLGDLVEGVLAVLPLVLTEDHEKHMLVQGRLSGVSPLPETEDTEPQEQKQNDAVTVVAVDGSLPSTTKSIPDKDCDGKQTKIAAEEAHEKTVDAKEDAKSKPTDDW